MWVFGELPKWPKLLKQEVFYIKLPALACWALGQDSLESQ